MIYHNHDWNAVWAPKRERGPKGENQHAVFVSVISDRRVQPESERAFGGHGDAIYGWVDTMSVVHDHHDSVGQDESRRERSHRSGREISPFVVHCLTFLFWYSRTMRTLLSLPSSRANETEGKP